jgi:restriction system protein
MSGKIENLFDRFLGEDEGPRTWDWDDLYEIEDDSEFEELLADLWEQMGYETRRTSATGDDGADVVAIKNGIVRSNVQKIVIEAKYRTGENAVGSGVVRGMPGAKAMYDADISIVVTSNIFTGDAKRTAEELGVELVNGKELIKRLNQADIAPPELEFLD